MQVINSYLDNIRFIQQLRLYHLSRPKLKQWRKSRHTGFCNLDYVDRWILNNLPVKNLTMVDCAGWYFEQHGVSTTCLESDAISQFYWPSCYVEPDIFTHRPTYISESDPAVFIYPWFLKYATIDQFVNFLKVWVKSTTVINFQPGLVQHNHLKYQLIDLVRPLVPFKIQTINNYLWKIAP